jgi:microcystin-dependent protein
MSEPFIGEIRIVGFTFPPQGWAECNGQLLPINQNTALFSLLGTTYGGDGITTFALPDLRGRVPMHQGSNGQALHIQGEIAGNETVTLSAAELPAHSHTVNASAAQYTSNRPAGKALARGGAYAGAPDGSTTLNAATIGGGGANQPHDNLQPYLTVEFIIALFGIFPSRA